MMLTQLIDFPCPACGFWLEVQLVDVLTQSYRWCACCRRRVRLLDSGGTVSGAVANVDAAMKELESQLKRLFR